MSRRTCPPSSECAHSLSTSSKVFLNGFPAANPSGRWLRSAEYRMYQKTLVALLPGTTFERHVREKMMGKSRRALGALLASARHLLHAFANAGYSAPTQELQLILGPNGALMWTEVAQVRLPEQSSADPLNSPDVVVLTTSHMRAEISGAEPVTNRLGEAPAA